MAALSTAYLVTPLGLLAIDAADDGIVAVRFVADGGRDSVALPRCLAQARDELAAYFAGRLTAFSVPLLPQGTPFQRTVWSAVGDIPFGHTAAYRDIAAAVGSPAAVRAVGAANGRNPLPILIPCHRVVGADGSLTGYGGGLDKKAWLLAHEQRAFARRGAG